MRGDALHPDICDDETIQGITRLIVGYGRQYFRESLMPSAFTANIMEVHIAFLTSTLGFLVNQLSMVMPFIVIIIPEKC